MNLFWPGVSFLYKTNARSGCGGGQTTVQKESQLRENISGDRDHVFGGKPVFSRIEDNPEIMLDRFCSVQVNGCKGQSQ
jgi:hypothetical protein